MKSLHLALSAADTLGSLLELPRTVRSLAARVDRAIRSVDDMMIELAEAKEARRVAEEAMDQRDRQWQLVLDSRVQAAEARAKKYEAEVAFAVTEVERLITQREESRKLAEKAEAALASVKRARDTWQVDYTKVAEALGAVEHVSMGPVYPRPADECVARVEEMGRTVDALRAELEALKAPAAGDRVDVAKARGALQRLVDLAFNNPGDRPRFSIPVSPDDDDLILTRALEELAQAQRDREGDK